MADVVAGKVLSGATGNRASTRSTRKKKTQMLSPKKLCDFVINKVGKEKGFEAGCAELYRESYLETPTFAHYFKEANKEKNFSKSVWLYDSTRVITPEVDYYHASWVDGIRPNQYVLAQLPATPEAAKDFFKMLVHVKAEGLVIAEGGEEPSKHISSNFVAMPGGGGAKKSSSAEKSDDLSTAILNDNGLKGLKVVRYNKWIESISPTELVDMLEKGRKFMGCPFKGPLVITCKDGASKAGVVCFLDIESERFAKCGRMRHTETVKMIRTMRSNTFDLYELFDLGINGLIELCNRKKK